MSRTPRPGGASVGSRLRCPPGVPGRAVRLCLPATNLVCLQVRGLRELPTTTTETGSSKNYPFSFSEDCRPDETRPAVPSLRVVCPWRPRVRRSVRGRELTRAESPDLAGGRRPWDGAIGHQPFWRRARANSAQARAPASSPAGTAQFSSAVNTCRGNGRLHRLLRDGLTLP